MSLTIRILPRAQADFRRIHAYISDRSPAGAERWCEAFEAAANSVATRPETGSLATENELTGFELRQSLFRTRQGLTYRLVYAVDQGELMVLRVRGPGQPPLGPDEVPLT